MQPIDATAFPGSEALSVAEPGAYLIEHRSEARQSVGCDLWMIDHYGSTVLRCQCLDVSRNGMRLRVPLGYGVAEGQRYELRSHLPGSHSAHAFGLVNSRWATVVRTQLRIEDGEDHLEVGAVLDATESEPAHAVS